MPLRLLPHESLTFLAAFLIAAGCLLTGGLGPREGRSIEVGLLALAAAGVVALSAFRGRRDRLAALGVAVGAAALLLIAYEIREPAPGAAVASAAVAVTLAALVAAGRLGRCLTASGIILAAGAAELAQGVYFALGGSVVLVGPGRAAEWFPVVINATYIATGALVVVAELRRWRWTLAMAASFVTLSNVILAIAAFATASWVAVALHALLVAFVVGVLWRRVTVSVGSRIMGGFGAVALFVVLLAAALTFTLDRSADLDAGSSAVLQVLVLTGTVLLLAIAATFALLLARTIGRRMSVLTAAATSVASDRPYNGLVELREAGDDLDELARAFERMRARIATQADGLAALARSEAHRTLELSSVLDASTEVAIIGTDMAGLVTTFNTGAEMMLGWTAGEMLGTAGLQQILDPGEVAARARALGIPVGPDVILGLARSGTVDHQTWSYIRKDGTRLPVDVAVSARHDPRGEIIGFLGIARDLTAQLASSAALVAAKEAAESADRAKSAFLADMSHELRTPLNAILGFSELLTEQLAGTLTDRQKRHFSNIHTAGEHLLGLINDVLDLSKVEAGRFEMRPEVIEIGRLFEPTTVAARLAAAQAGITFECDSTATGLVRVDVARTRQVLFNLFSNAVKFTKGPGVVKLDVRFDGDALVFAITDTGIGIPAAEGSRVFRAFERVNRERSNAPGTGLGLALSERIVQLQGGTISFESVVGRGTTFTVALPDARYRVKLTEAILIVEDNWADAELLAALAGAEGLSTDRVATLADATEAMRRGRPLAVILDLFLPDGHGASILEAVRASPESADVPVLIVTSSTETARFRLMGADCMTKPIDTAAVRTWLRRVAARVSPKVAA